MKLQRWLKGHKFLSYLLIFYVLFFLINFSSEFFGMVSGNLKVVILFGLLDFEISYKIISYQMFIQLLSVIRQIFYFVLPIVVILFFIFNKIFKSNKKNNTQSL